MWNIRAFWILAKLWLVRLVKPDIKSECFCSCRDGILSVELFLAPIEGITDEFRYKAKAFEKPV